MHQQTTWWGYLREEEGRDCSWCVCALLWTDNTSIAATAWEYFSGQSVWPVLVVLDVLMCQMYKGSSISKTSGAAGASRKLVTSSKMPFEHGDIGWYWAATSIRALAAVIGTGVGIQWLLCSNHLLVHWWLSFWALKASRSQASMELTIKDVGVISNIVRVWSIQIDSALHRRLNGAGEQWTPRFWLRDHVCRVLIIIN